VRSKNVSFARAGLRLHKLLRGLDIYLALPFMGKGGGNKNFFIPPFPIKGGGGGRGFGEG
jgi:hypothetical protein